jgi:hypothetical protein
MLSPILQMAMDLLVLGLQHFLSGEPLDNRLTILHLDQSIELSLKERARLGGKAIMKPSGKESISLYEAYKHLDDLVIVIPEKPNLELLHEQRNQIQHLFSSPDENTTRFHVDNALFFLSRFYSDEFGMILVDYIPPGFIAHEKLRFLEDMEKLRGLFESSEQSFKNKKQVEAAATLVAALDLSLQFKSEKKKNQLVGNSTEELLNDAEAKKVFTKRGVVSAKQILTINTEIVSGNIPTEDKFITLINNFRKETQ